MDLQDILNLILASTASLVILFLLTKFMGNKQMSQLSMFDYICGITIGSIAAEMATELEEIWKPLLAMVIYAIVSVIISYANYRSIWLRRVLTGRALILMHHDKLYKGNLRKARIDLHEFMMIARNNGYFDLSQIETAILEPNGKISFLPKAKHRPLSPSDMNLPVNEDHLVANVIIDGHIMFQNLKYTGNNEDWLMKQLKVQGVSKVKDVFLATCSADNKLTVYTKHEDLYQKDILE